MKYYNNLYKLINGIIVVVFFFPFFYISKYVYMFSDDFSRVGYDFSSFYERVIFWLNHENGRYINAIITNLPVYDLRFQRVFPILLFGLLFTAFYAFLSSLSEMSNLKIPKVFIILSSILLEAQLISKLPLVPHFFYWFAASTVYLIPFTSLLFLFSNFIKKKYFGRNFIVNSLLILICCGSNEMSALIIAIILGYVIIGLLLEKENSRCLSFFLRYIPVFIIAFLPLILLEGAKTRISYYEKSTNFFNALYDATYSTIAVSVNNIFDIQNFILALFFLILFSGRFNFKIIITRRSILSFGFKVLLSLSCFWAGFFVLYYGVGRATFNLHRTGNFLNAIFLIVFCYNLFNVLIFFQVRNRPRESKGYHFTLISVVLGLSILQILSNNYQVLVQDITSGKAKEFSNQIDHRLKFLQKTKSTDIVIPAVVSPQTIYLEDIFPDSENVNNRWYTAMINRLYDKKIKSVSAVY